jgi:integrase
LKAHRLRQNEERLARGIPYGDRDLVFATGRGTPFEASNVVNRSFKPLLKKAGLPDIPFHATRHTCATLMLANDVDARTVQDILGHRDVATTLRFYGHVLPSMRRRAGAVFDEAKPAASPSEAGDAS